MIKEYDLNEAVYDNAAYFVERLAKCQRLGTGIAARHAAMISMRLEQPVRRVTMSMGSLLGEWLSE